MRLMAMRLVKTGASDFLDVFAHPKAGVAKNVQLRILHNRALDLEWMLRPVLSKKAWPKIRYGHRRGITREQHESVLRVTPNKEYRLYFELLWLTGAAKRTSQAFGLKILTGIPAAFTTNDKSPNPQAKATPARWNRIAVTRRDNRGKSGG